MEPAEMRLLAGIATSATLEKALEAFRRIPECAAAVEAQNRDAFNHVDVVFRLGGRDVRREADVLFQALFNLALIAERSH